MAIKNSKLLPITLELFGMAVVGIGIGVELMMREAIGAVIITAGSLVITAGAIIWGKFMRRR